MTISTQTGSATYQGNGSSKAFGIPYRVDSLTHLRVYVTDRSVTPPSVVQIASGDYEVTGDFTLGNATLNYPKSSSLTPLPSTQWITIERVVPLVQDVNFSTVGGYFKEDAEGMGDKIVQMVQQVNDKLARAVLVPVGSGISPDEYTTTITQAVSQAEEAATRAENAVIDMPAVPFKEAFLIGGVSPFSINQSHNGHLAVATVGAGGLVVNLPQMSSLTFPYLVAIQRESGSGTMTVNAYAGDNIVGSSSKTMETNGETIMFIADNDTLAGRWTIVSHGSGSYATGSVNEAMLADGAVTANKIASNAVTASKLGTSSVTTSKIADDAVTSNKIADDSITLAHLTAEVDTLLNALPFRDNQLISADKTADASNNGMLFKVAASGTINITLPATTSITAPYWLVVRRESGSGTINVLRSSTDTIDGATSYTFTSTVGNAVIFIPDFTGGTVGQWAKLVLGTDASIADNSISTAKIQDLAVITAKLADLGITTAKIADSAVTTPKIADGATTTAKLADNAVSVAKFAQFSDYSILGRLTTGTGNISGLTLGDRSLPMRKTGNVKSFALSNDFTLLDSGSTQLVEMGIPLQGGRLTLVSGSPAPDVGASSPQGYSGTGATLYYTPYIHDRITLYDTSNSLWRLVTFTETSIAAPTSTGTFDVFAVWATPTSMTLEYQKWGSANSRSSFSLSRVNGILVLTSDYSRRYLGTVYADTANSLNDTTRQRHIWNMYNRLQRTAYAYESTASWSYTTASWRPANNTTANRVEFVRGLDEEAVNAILTGKCSNTNGYLGIGRGTSSADVSLQGTTYDVSVGYCGKVGIGFVALYMLEYGGASSTFYGGGAYGNLPFRGIVANATM